MSYSLLFDCGFLHSQNPQHYGNILPPLTPLGHTYTLENTIPSVFNSIMMLWDFCIITRGKNDM